MPRRVSIVSLSTILLLFAIASEIEGGAAADRQSQSPAPAARDVGPLLDYAEENFPTEHARLVRLFGACGRREAALRHLDLLLLESPTAALSSLIALLEHGDVDLPTAKLRFSTAIESKGLANEAALAIACVYTGDVRRAIEIVRLKENRERRDSILVAVGAALVVTDQSESLDKLFHHVLDDENQARLTAGIAARVARDYRSPERAERVLLPRIVKHLGAYQDALEHVVDAYMALGDRDRVGALVSQTDESHLRERIRFWLVEESSRKGDPAEARAAWSVAREEFSSRPADRRDTESYLRSGTLALGWEGMRAQLAIDLESGLHSLDDVILVHAFLGDSKATQTAAERRETDGEMRTWTFDDAWWLAFWLHQDLRDLPSKFPVEDFKTEANRALCRAVLAAASRAGFDAGIERSVRGMAVDHRTYFRRAVAEYIAAKICAKDVASAHRAAAIVRDEPPQRCDSGAQAHKSFGTHFRAAILRAEVQPVEWLAYLRGASDSRERLALLELYLLDAIDLEHPLAGADVGETFWWNAKPPTRD